MGKTKREGFFWISYSDLMTSLFFVMLVLFVLSSAGMYMSEQATRQQLQKINEIKEAVNKLPQTYFQEDTINKRWTLRETFTPHFPSMSDVIPASDTTKIIEVGKSLQNVIMDLNELKKQEKYKELDVKYMVVIEGMASKVKYQHNDELSYRRALAVYYLWKDNGINFENSDCEVQVSGSGERGIRPYNREYYEAMKKVSKGNMSLKKAENLFDIDEEVKNQCIIVQIIPKISNIE